MPMARKSRDAWSPAFIVGTIAGTLAFLLLLETSDATPPFLIMLVPWAVIVIVVRLLFDLVRLRWRHAMSIAASVGVAVILIYVELAHVGPWLRQAKDIQAFQTRLPDFERQVEEARARLTTPGPLQVVVDYQDRSRFVTANLFYYVIYDETDGAGPYKADHWLYAKSPTETIQVQLPTKRRHLTGHFYDFSTSY